MKHSRIGASSRHRWANCPGSVQLCATLPPAPSSKYADEGTLAHEYAANAVLYVLGKLNTEPPMPDAEMQEAVKCYLEEVFRKP